MTTANLAKMVKPAVGERDVTSEDLIESSGVVEEGACRQNRQGSWETRRDAGRALQRRLGIHNEWSVVSGVGPARSVRWAAT